MSEITDASETVPGSASASVGIAPIPSTARAASSPLAAQRGQCPRVVTARSPASTVNAVTSPVVAVTAKDIVAPPSRSGPASNTAPAKKVASIPGGPRASRMWRSVNRAPQPVTIAPAPTSSGTSAPASPSTANPPPTNKVVPNAAASVRVSPSRDRCAGIGSEGPPTKCAQASRTVCRTFTTTASMPPSRTVPRTTVPRTGNPAAMRVGASATASPAAASIAFGLSGACGVRFASPLSASSAG
ncbi:hypothetical protein GCM10023321_50320 [Pseudonocardia eucalypti]|uniref:Uncharacterized protein n=1 Tax=Pseudonocardia eucalypti TaxID=648755 RepID=A0ABP9QKE2_9PSEU